MQHDAGVPLVSLLRCPPGAGGDLVDGGQDGAAGLELPDLQQFGGGPRLVRDLEHVGTALVRQSVSRSPCTGGRRCSREQRQVRDERPPGEVNPVAEIAAARRITAL